MTNFQEAYTRLEQHADAEQLGPDYDRLLDLSEQEAENSLKVANAIFGDGEVGEGLDEALRSSQLNDELKRISEDLDARWRGALFSLHPGNPDAARHFCTSSREVITGILDVKAPDNDVMHHIPDCDRTDSGKPTRKAKVKFLLHQKGMRDAVLEDFVEKDIDNVVALFRDFNDGTHGSAGKFSLSQLTAIKKRVEGAVLFLAEIAH